MIYMFCFVLLSLSLHFFQLLYTVTLVMAKLILILLLDKIGCIPHLYILLIDWLTQKHKNIVYKECAIEKNVLGYQPFSNLFDSYSNHLELSVKKKKKCFENYKILVYFFLCVWFIARHTEAKWYYQNWFFFITVIKSAHLKVWAERLDLLKWLTINGTEWNRHMFPTVYGC